MSLIKDIIINDKYLFGFIFSNSLSSDISLTKEKFSINKFWLYKLVDKFNNISIILFNKKRTLLQFLLILLFSLSVLFNKTNLINLKTDKKSFNSANISIICIEFGNSSLKSYFALLVKWNLSSKFLLLSNKNLNPSKVIKVISYI